MEQYKKMASKFAESNSQNKTPFSILEAAKSGNRIHFENRVWSSEILY